jgi:hypothetical protein
MADSDAFTCEFAEFSSKWRTGFSNLRGGSKNRTVVQDSVPCKQCGSHCASHDVEQRAPAATARHRGAFGGNRPHPTPAVAVISLATTSTHVESLLCDPKSNGRWLVLNPAQPKENFVDKWNEPDTAHRRQEFNGWLRRVQRDIEIAAGAPNSGLDVLVDRLSSTFDRKVLEKSAANWARTTVDLRERGRLGITSGTGALVIGSPRPTPLHGFYGRGRA